MIVGKKEIGQVIYSGPSHLRLLLTEALSVLCVLVSERFVKYDFAPQLLMNIKAWLVKDSENMVITISIDCNYIFETAWTKLGGQ